MFDPFFPNLPFEHTEQNNERLLTVKESQTHCQSDDGVHLERPTGLRPPYYDGAFDVVRSKSGSLDGESLRDYELPSTFDCEVCYYFTGPVELLWRLGEGDYG